MKGRIVDLKRFAVHDGPGIRTTIFVKGCPLACRWCHNPESISSQPEIGFLKKKCVGCGKCAEACPNGAHTFRNGAHVFDRSKCTACGKCVEACLPGALEYYGREITADEAVKAVMEDKNFYANSGGGCTISGGEPLLQAEFCAEVFSRLRNNGIHCAIDTSGAVPWTAFETVLPYTSMFLYDFKHIKAQAHRRHTSLSNKLILENLRKLSAGGIPIEIRMPLIPGINNADSDLKAAGEFLGRLANITVVRLLPYHALARSKYEAVGRPDTMPNVPAPDTGAMAKAAEILRQYGLNPLMSQ